MAGLAAIPVSTVIAEAIYEVRLLQPGNSVPPDTSALVLSNLNRLLDDWNVEAAGAYVIEFPTFTYTPGLSPHTIGPTGTFVMDPRPTDLLGANTITGSGASAVRYPITLKDADWWRSVLVPGWGTNYPTGVYYDPSWPNGSLYYWPVPSAALTAELEVRGTFAQVTDASTIWLPPGYRNAVTLTLAEMITPAFGGAAQLSPITKEKAQEARGRIFGNNVEMPRIDTADAGMPGRNLPPWFDWRTGRMR